MNVPLDTTEIAVSRMTLEGLELLMAAEIAALEMLAFVDDNCTIDTPANTKNNDSHCK